jgi:hypothetical protein
MSWRDRIRDIPAAELDYDTLEWERWSIEDRMELLEEFQRKVPKERRQNGVEIERTYVQPSSPIIEGDTFLKWGAKELLLGELEAHVVGEPPTSIDEWNAIRTSAEHALSGFLTHGVDNPETAPELSLHGHAKRAIAAFDHLDFLESFYAGQHEIPDDVIAEAISEAARAGFAAGRHTQAALNKPWEPDAVSRRQQKKSLEGNTRAYNEARKELVKLRRRVVAELVAKTSLERGALIIHLINELAAQGFLVNKSTVYTDLKYLQELKKVSNTS